MAGPQQSSRQLELRDAFFARIVPQYGRLLFRVAHSVLRHPADAEDAVAEALLKILRTGGWQDISNEKAFLSRTVWNAALDRFTARPPRPDDLALLDDVLDHRPSPEHSAIQGEQRAVLHALIEQLPADLRDPLLLSAVEDLNSREIGELLHLPEGTVRTRLMRARQRLRSEYETKDRHNRDREIVTRGAER